MIRTLELTVVLDDRPILDRLSFEVANGEAVALVGPNGSGKSTALRCLLGLVPYTGTVTIAGNDAQRDGVAARSLMSTMSQRPAFGEATGREALAFLARLRGRDPAAIPGVLERMGLLDHADARVRTYSGGMQQRLSLAAVLLADTPVILLDEPTASLDRQGQQLFREVAAGWREQGRTLVLATHRADEVRELADRVIELEEGRLAGGPGARVVPIQRARGVRCG